MLGAFLVLGWTILTLFGSILCFLIRTKISANLSGLCTINILPLSFSNRLAAIITSSNVHITSCLAIANLSFGLTIPALFNLYGGLTVNTSNLPNESNNALSFKSPWTNFTTSVVSLSIELLFAISTISSCISSPTTSFGSYLP